MKTTNAIKRLERAGFEVRHRGNFDFEADKGTQRITWIDRDGEAQSLYLLDMRFTDDPQSDYFAGVYPRSLKAAIELAESAIKREREEAPMIARKQREAQESLEAAAAIAMAEKSIAQAKVVGDMFKRIVLQN